MVFENFDTGNQIIDSLQTLGVQIEELEVFERTVYDFNIIIIPGSDCYKIKMIYNNSVYRDAQIRWIEGHFRYIFDQVIQNPDIPLHEISLMREEERQRVLCDFNATQVPVPENATLVDFFRDTMKRFPDRTAIVSGNRSFTYQQLDKKTDCLASYLRTCGVGRNTIVAVLMDRSPEMIFSIYSVLKAGGAYLPIDPTNPAARITEILDDSQAVMVLTKKEYEALVSPVFHMFFVQEEQLCEEFGGEIPADTCGGNDLCYVIYTSGSTGKPKGVMIDHHSIVNRLIWMQKQYPLSSDDVILQKTLYTFDVSVWELFWWSLTGSCLCLLETDGEKNPQAILQAIEQYHISVLHFVPSMLSMFLEYLSGHTAQYRMQSLKWVFASGEALFPEQVSRFHTLIKAASGAELVNLYGPTEAAVDVTCYPCTNAYEDKIPIGKPIDNIRIYIVDGYGNPQPIGVSGELCIAGTGVARGYLNRPELTQERFVEIEGEYAYKTGDIAQWTQDGNILYKGRMDGQRKIRGHRVELGEIENAISKLNMVSHVSVLAKKSDETEYLQAYLVLMPGAAIEAIRSHLEQILPAYMIPSYFTELKTMPCLPNGKADHKALLALQTDTQSAVVSDEIKSETEHLIAQIWAQLLQIDAQSIAKRDNFFHIGGNSLKIVQMHNQLEKALQKSIAIADLFTYAVLDQLASFLDADSMDRKWPIRCIELGNAFVSDQGRDGENAVLKLDVSFVTKQLGMLDSKWNDKFTFLYMALFLYLLAEITQNNTVVFLIVSSEMKVIPVEYDLNLIDSIEDLAQKILAANTQKDEMPATRIDRTAEQGKCGVLPVLCDGEIDRFHQVRESTDICFYINQQDQYASITFLYDDRYLSTRGLKNLLSQYYDLLMDYLHESQSGNKNRRTYSDEKNSEECQSNRVEPYGGD